MVLFRRGELGNGLRVLVNEDRTARLSSVALCYHVGSKDEGEEEAGYAHLFEHLMFGGSVNVPDYDAVLESVGGNSNAYTSQDFTCYHSRVPTKSLETLFWLESDRMLALDFREEPLRVQRGVVSEEFREHYLNAPYGDVSHLLHGLAYKRHSYRWPTIGTRVELIEEATLGAVERFFHHHYAPNNAVLAVSGPMGYDAVYGLVERWFADIPRRKVTHYEGPREEWGDGPRCLRIERPVPVPMLVMAFPMGGRTDATYDACDILSDALSSGGSSRLKHRLVRERKIFTEVNAPVMGYEHPGLLVVSGMLATGVSLAEAEEAVWGELRETARLTEEELLVCKARYATSHAHELLDAQERAIMLAEREWLGGAELVAEEVARRDAVSLEEVREEAIRLFDPQRAVIIHYDSNQ